MAYFFRDTVTEKQHLRGLISSLAFQELSEDTLWQCLLEVPGQPAMYIVIDALDECPNISGMPTAREQVLEFLQHLVKLKLPNVHICVSSRLEIDI